MVTKREAQKELFRANFGWPKDVTVAPHARRGSRGVRGHHRTLTSAQESWALYTNGLVDGWRLGTEQAVEGAIEGGDPLRRHRAERGRRLHGPPAGVDSSPAEGVTND